MPAKKGDAKQQIKNFFISGLDDNTDIEIKRKVILINVISIIGIINLVPLGISAIIREKLTLGTFDLIVASVLIVLLVLLRKSGYHLLISFFGVAFAGALFVFLDVSEQRKLASKILSKLGYSVKSASNGEEAVNFIRNETPDLIVLDMIMSPGIDGLETYERIISTHPNQKAIIASGFSETNRVKKAQQLGAGTYVRKPYTIEKIGIAVKAELEKDKIAA